MFAFQRDADVASQFSAAIAFIFHATIIAERARFAENATRLIGLCGGAMFGWRFGADCELGGLKKRALNGVTRVRGRKIRNLFVLGEE